MVRLDSVTVEAPCHVLQDWHSAKFCHRPQFKAGQLLESGYVAESGKDFQHTGLKRIAINEKTGVLTFELSAKILMQEYHSLINIDTIEQAIHSVNSSGLVKIHPNMLLEEASVRKCDITNNIPLQDIELTASEAHKIIAAASIGSGWKAKEQSKTSFEYTSGGKKGERVIFYEKVTELQKDKSFLKELAGKASDVLRKHSNQIRIESSYKSFRAIRKACFHQIHVKGKGMQPDKTDARNENMPKLLHILESQSIPNLHLFERITSQHPNIHRFANKFNDCGSDWKKYIFRCGIEGLISDCGGDWNAVELALNHMFSTSKKTERTHRNYKTQVKAVYQELKRKECKQITGEHPLIAHIKTQLKAA